MAEGGGDGSADLAEVKDIYCSIDAMR